MDVLQINDDLFIAIRDAIAEEVAKPFDSKVVSGPFAGMLIGPEQPWRDGNRVTKLLGCYERELHPHIEKAIQRKPNAVVNVGCAEGFYAVGFAQRMPSIPIFAMDTSEEAIRATFESAKRNGVQVFGKVLPENDFDVRLLDIDATHRLYLVDCEGAEMPLFGNSGPPFDRDELIIECHDFIEGPGWKLGEISERLYERFSQTHDCQIVDMEYPVFGAFPNIHVSHLLEALMITEMRPRDTRWLVCWARM